MRKLSLAAIGMYVGILASFGQASRVPDSSAYKQKKLTLDEVNFVSGYYNQDGNNSAVTGGIGTEKLNDFANTIELKLSKYDSRQRKHSFGFELGIDHYTSASSDNIDPRILSSASMSDTRIYPSASWSIQNEQKGTTVGVNASFSKEYDYTSFGTGLNFSKSSKDNNREFSAKAQAFFDTWKVIYPYELKPAGYGSGDEHSGNLDYTARNSYNLSLSYLQVVNKQLQLMFLLDPTMQSGLLATKYQRVYFTTGAEKVENLPGNRTKIPIGVRASYFIGDKFIVRSFYRYYQDDWGVKAHTIELETPVKITPFFSLSPFYRFYTQTVADYFAPYAAHNAAETYYTSDYDLSKFNSNFYGIGIRTAPPKGVLGIQHWSAMELRYGRYNRSNGLQANSVTLHVTFK